MQDLISTKEAAKKLNVSHKTLEKWRERKLFGVPFFAADEMRGGTWYYERERVEQLKSVYQKGVLQNMYKLAKALDSIPSADFQKPPTSGCTALSTGFYKPESVAKFLGVDESTLSRWRDKEIFVEDYKTHVGISLYSQDRVLEMKMFCQKNVDKQAEPSKFSDVIMAEDPHGTMHKISGSLRPSRIRVEINDKLAKVIFKLNDEDSGDMLEGETYNIIEKRNLKGQGEILTAFKILNKAGYQVLRSFTMFDRFVLAVCISEWLAGNSYTTVAIIYRALTGKIGRSDAKPSVTQRKAIIESLEILMSRMVDYGAEEVCTVMGYNSGNRFYGKGALLPAAYVDFSAVNGDDDTLIFFTAEPPLLKMAQAKKQLISYDARLLDIPGQQNTPMNIASKNYTMLRIQEINLHKQLTPTITFGDVFKKLRMENAHVEIKRRIREYMIAFFEHLKKASVIKSFEVVKHGNTFYGIKFPRPKKS